MKTARPVSMQELTDWVEKNKHRTWHFENFGNGPSLEIKYLDFCLDTRDMKVFTIGVRGLGEDFSCDFREEFDGSILDLLEHKLDQEKK